MEQNYVKNIKNFIILLFVFFAFSVTIYLDKRGVKTISEALHILSGQESVDIKYQKEQSVRNLEEKIIKQRASDNYVLNTNNSHSKVPMSPLAKYNQDMNHDIWSRYLSIKGELSHSEPTIIFIVINNNGKLVKREIIASSGNIKNDRLALSLFPKNSIYNQLPDGVSQMNITYTIGKTRFSSQSRIKSNNMRG